MFDHSLPQNKSFNRSEPRKASPGYTHEKPDIKKKKKTDINTDQTVTLPGPAITNLHLFTHTADRKLTKHPSEVIRFQANPMPLRSWTAISQQHHRGRCVLPLPARAISTHLWEKRCPRGGRHPRMMRILFYHLPLPPSLANRNVPARASSLNSNKMFP